MTIMSPPVSWFKFFFKPAFVDQIVARTNKLNNERDNALVVESDMVYRLIGALLHLAARQSTNRRNRAGGI